MPKRLPRLPWIDRLRASAILLMILYHMAYDLKEYAHVPIDYHHPLWFSIGKASALLFIILSGFSAGLSKNPLKRGLQVLAWGGVITLVTYLWMPDEFVRFGILHLLGMGMLLSPYLLRLPPLLLLFIASGIGAGGYWAALRTTVSPTWLLPFGLTYREFSSIDYYPLFPYLSATILGVLFFKYYEHLATEYKPDTEGEKRTLIPPSRLGRLVESLSKHSLAIYLIHQPLLVSGIFLLTHPIGGLVKMLLIPHIFIEFKAAFYLLATTWIILFLIAVLLLGNKLLHHVTQPKLQIQAYPEIADVPIDHPQGDGTGGA